MKRIENYIGGEMLRPTSDNYLENVNPATGEVYSLVPDSDGRDVELAATAARSAFPLWSSLPHEERFARLMKLTEAIEHNAEMLAAAESTDNGKPVSLARRVDIPRAAANFRFYAAAALHTANESHETYLPGGERAINYTLRQPVGIAGCISPWNLPLYLFTWKLAPALAAGCTVIAKPSEITPMTAYLLSELCIEAGLPPGVLNIVHGSGQKVGTAIVVHKDVRAISFTGGTQTGEDIAAKAAPMFKKLSLELGGKNPNIIFADCDYDEMLETTVRSSFSNQGEICLCGSRIFVERGLYEQFKADFVNRTAALKVGDPLEPVTDVGAIVSRGHFEKIMSYIDLARREGGTILTGGERVQLNGRCSDGWFIAPTVIEGLPHDCRTNQEEIFGPVVAITPFDSEEDVIRKANSVRYGLSATLWTENLARAHRISALLESGVVWVNCWMLRDLRTPFGGVKESGLGREGGFEAVKFFTEEKNICIKI